MQGAYKAQAPWVNAKIFKLSKYLFIQDKVFEMLLEWPKKYGKRVVITALYRYILHVYDVKDIEVIFFMKIGIFCMLSLRVQRLRLQWSFFFIRLGRQTSVRPGQPIINK